jgi:hypothetical protein
MNEEMQALVIKAMNTAAFAEELARCVGDQATAKILDEFYNQVNQKLDERVKDVVDYYIEHYKREEIQRIVDRAIGNITKKELLEKL